MSIETAITLVVLLAMLIGAVYDFRKTEKQNREINRAVDERNQRKAEADERTRIYEENYQREGRVLKKCVLENVKAIARGEKVRLDPEAVEAAKALQVRQGDHPETVAAWAPLIEDLSAEILDPKAIQSRLGDLLYPETLEDIEALKKQVIDDVEKVTRGEKSRLDPEALDAAKALNEIRERDARKKREEREAEALERRLEKEKDKKFRATMDEMARSSARNILRIYGLPENTLDGLSLDETLIRIRTLRELRELAKKPFEERDRILHELESQDRAREERKSGA